MQRMIAACRALAVVFGLAMAAHPVWAQERDWDEWESVTFQASDGVTVYGDLFSSSMGQGGPLILLFHQGGADGRGEYGPIVGRLAEQGFSMLVIDQRRGGDRFGGPNRTTADLAGIEFGYCNVYPDMEAALGFVVERGFVGPLVAWGSSYSAALAIRLAADHGDRLAAALAFSPASGKPMDGCGPELYTAQVEVPILVLRPANEMEIESVSRRMLEFSAAGLETYVAASEGHGSSILVAERSGEDPLLWAVVLRFLRETTAPDAP